MMIDDEKAMMVGPLRVTLRGGAARTQKSGTTLPAPD